MVQNESQCMGKSFHASYSWAEAPVEVYVMGKQRQLLLVGELPKVVSSDPDWGLWTGVSIVRCSKSRLGYHMGKLRFRELQWLLSWKIRLENGKWSPHDPKVIKYRRQRIFSILHVRWWLMVLEKALSVTIVEHRFAMKKVKLLRNPLCPWGTPDFFVKWLEMT